MLRGAKALTPGLKGLNSILQPSVRIGTERYASTGKLRVLKYAHHSESVSLTLEQVTGTVLQASYVLPVSSRVVDVKSDSDYAEKIKASNGKLCLLVQAEYTACMPSPSLQAH